jgi:hypothetical protein
LRLEGPLRYPGRFADIRTPFACLPAVFSSAPFTI